MLDKGPSNYTTNDFKHVFYLCEPKAIQGPQNFNKVQRLQRLQRLQHFEAIYKKKDKGFFFTSQH